MITGATTLVTPPAAAVFGVAAVAWANPPTEEELVAATQRVAALADALAEPTEARAPFCGCAGNAVVDAAADSELSFGPVAGSNLPTAECAARVASTTTVGLVISLPVEGVGQESATLKGIFFNSQGRRRRTRSRRSLQQFGVYPYCSTPLVVDGGVEGVPADDLSCLGPLGVATEDFYADVFDIYEGEPVLYDNYGEEDPVAPVSFDTFERRPCSSPPLASTASISILPGILGAPSTGTCGVESFFRAGAAADASTAACLLLQVTLPVSPEPLADLLDPCAGAPGAALDNAPCMPITNDNENTNENTSTLLNDNTNLAENTNAQTVGNEAAGGVSGDSASSSASNPNTAIGNPISIGVGATGR